MLRISNPRNTLAIALLMALGTACFAAKPPSLEEGRKHWAFQPWSQAQPPSVKNVAWPQNDVDRFILAKLENAGLQPSPEADPATLVRRVTMDLTGLPPSPEEVAAFVHESRSSHQSHTAYERLIDRLLDSPHYGERWGRHWLDLARYADTSGFHNDLDRPYAWKYRDYVIRSFNDDKPYARFVAEQIAGDEIDGANEESLIATGFCRNGPSNDDNMGKNDDALAQYRADQLDDVISTTSTVFLGITIGCARCHDHKTDPLLQKDYYSLLAIFNGTEMHGLVPGSQDKNDKKIKLDPAIQVHALIEKNPRVPVTRVMLRGSVLNLGDEVQPSAPVVLTAQPLRFPEPATKTSLRRRTLADWITSPDNPLTWRVLANRVWQHHFGQGIVATPSNLGFTGARPTHPELLDYLAAQLVANGGRLKPLHKLMLMSATYRQASSDTETRRRRDAERTTAGSVSASHGLIVSASSPDPANALLWRMNKQRMEAEVLRDSILSVSGRLNAERGGPGIKPRLRPDLLPVSQRNKWPALEKEGPQQWRRSVYIYVKRQLLMPSMELFDAPTTTDSCALRMNSTVPTQALVLMNDEFVEDQAAFLAARAVKESNDDIAKTIDRLFQITLSRSSTEKRMSESLAFVRQRESQSNRVAALTDLAHVLLNSSEFIYIE